MVQLSQLYMTTGKDITLTLQTFVGRVISLLFNTQSRYVIALLPRGNHPISQLQSPSTVILGPKKRKSVTASTFPPSICHELMEQGAMILVFLFFFFWYLVLSWLFHCPPLPSSRGSLVPLHFLPLDWLSSAYLRLLMFLLPILIPAYNSFTPAFLMMCSAYKLNKLGAIRQHFLNPDTISFSIQDSNCCFLNCIQVSQETGKMVWYSHFFKSFPQFVMIHIVKYLSIVDETEVDDFLEFSGFL